MCPECMAELEEGLMAAHCQTQHGMIWWPQWASTLPTPPPRLYRASFLWESGLMGFPVEGCRGRASTRPNLWNHSVHCHMQDGIVILEEDNRPYPLFPPCEMFVPCADMNKHHTTTALCVWGVYRKW